MIELQQYSSRRNLGFQVHDNDGSVCISTTDGAESVNVPYDLLNWLIGELHDYLDDCKLNGSVTTATLSCKQHTKSGDECGKSEFAVRLQKKGDIKMP
jgi:hypothetical protein